MDTKQEQIVTQSQQESQTEILDIKKPEQFKTLPQEIPRESILLTESNESALLSTEQDTANISNIEIIPEKPTPIQDIVTIVESGTPHLKLGRGALKTKIVKVEESRSKKSIEIYQADIKESVEALHIAGYARGEAKKQITKHQQHITVDKPVIQEEVSEWDTIEKKHETASLIIGPLEAQSSEEIVSFTSEEKLVPRKKSIAVQAHYEITPMETIEVSQVFENEGAEEHAHQIKVKGIIVEPTLTISENIEVSEVITEDRPDKYYPELIVPTESATEKLVEHKSYITQETSYSEHEESIVSKIEATKVVANLEVSESLSLQVEQTTLSDKEIVMQPKKRPETFKASPEFGLFEGMTTAQTDIQSPLGEHPTDDVEKKSAELKLLEEQPISSETVHIQEPVTNLELPITTTALGTQEFSTFESPLVTENIVHESYQDLRLGILGTDQQASIRISTAQQAASSQQIISLETSEDLFMRSESKEAKVLQVETYLTSGEQSENIPVEKEENIKPDAIPSSLSLKPTIGENDFVVVEQIQTGETEEEFLEKEKPLQQKATSKSNLQRSSAAVTNEPHIVHTTGVIDDLKVATEEAQRDYEIKIAHSTGEQTVLQGTRSIHHEKVISQTATPQILPQTAMIVTESYPIDSGILDEKITKTFNAKEKRDDHHYKSVVVQEITPHMSVEDLESLKSNSFVIDISLAENIAKSVAEHTCLEEEAMLPTEIKPTEQVATTEFDIRDYLEYHKAFLQEKEIPLPKQESPAIQEAKFSETQKLFSPTVHGVQTLESIDKIQESIPVTQRAKQHLDHLQSVVGSDVTSFEAFEDLKDLSKITEDTVNIDFVTNKSLEVSISRSTEKESSFEGAFNPSFNEASTVLDDYERSIEVTQVETIDKTEDFNVSVAQKESIKHTEAPLQEISIAESNIWDKESQIKPTQFIRETVNVSEEPRNLKAPLVQTIEDNVSLMEILEEKPKPVTGKMLQDTLNETITSEVSPIDTTLTFEIPEKSSDKPSVTIAEGSLAPSEFTLITIDQSLEFVSKVPDMKNVTASMTESNMTPLKDVVQTEETTLPFDSPIRGSSKTAKPSVIEGKQVAMTTQEVTFDRTTEMLQKIEAKFIGQSTTEEHSTTLQEMQTELESVDSFRITEIVEDKPKISLLEIDRIAPLVTSEVKSEKEGQLKEQDIRISVAKLGREKPSVTSLVEIVVPSCSTGETDTIDSRPRKAALIQDEIIPLLTEEQVSVQEIAETFKLDLKTSTASIGVVERKLKGVTSEEMLVLESSMESKDLVRESVIGSQTVGKPLSVPIHTITRALEIAEKFDSEDLKETRITETLEPAHTAVEQRVTFEQFKEGNLQIDTQKPQYPKTDSEFHKSINTYEIYPFESETSQDSKPNAELYMANSKETKYIPLISESTTPLESFENFDDSIIAVRPRETIEEDTKLQSLQHKINILVGGKYIIMHM